MHLPFSVEIIDRSASSHGVWHSHAEGQIFMLSRGLITVETYVGVWAIPPKLIGWIPPNCNHCGISYGQIIASSIKVTAEYCKLLPDTPCVVSASTLMLALIDRLDSAYLEGVLGTPEINVLRVLVDEIARAVCEPLYLPMPTDPRLTRMALAIINEPSSQVSLDEWAVQLYISRRTLTRRFKKETGLSLGQWRLQAKLHYALRMLSEGSSVTQVAIDLGYNSISAFSRSFKSVFGFSPSFCSDTKRILQVRTS